jgi:hypothetical protein
VPGWDRRLDREVLALLCVLTGCVSIERSQQDLFDQVCSGPTITIDELARARVTFDSPQRNGNGGVEDSDPALFVA